MSSLLTCLTSPGAFALLFRAAPRGSGLGSAASEVRGLSRYARLPAAWPAARVRLRGRWQLRLRRGVRKVSDRIVWVGVWHCVRSWLEHTSLNFSIVYEIKSWREKKGRKKEKGKRKIDRKGYVHCFDNSSTSPSASWLTLKKPDGGWLRLLLPVDEITSSSAYPYFGGRDGDREFQHLRDIFFFCNVSAKKN